MLFRTKLIASIRFKVIVAIRFNKECFPTLGYKLRLV